MPPTNETHRNRCHSPPPSSTPTPRHLPFLPRSGDKAGPNLKAPPRPEPGAGLTWVTCLPGWPQKKTKHRCLCLPAWLTHRAGLSRQVKAPTSAQHSSLSRSGHSLAALHSGPHITPSSGCTTPSGPLRLCRCSSLCLQCPSLLLHRTRSSSLLR